MIIAVLLHLCYNVHGKAFLQSYQSHYGEMQYPPNYNWEYDGDHSYLSSYGQAPEYPTQAANQEYYMPNFDGHTLYVPPAQHSLALTGDVIDDYYSGSKHKYEGIINTHDQYGTRGSTQGILHEDFDAQKSKLTMPKEAAERNPVLNAYDEYGKSVPGTKKNDKIAYDKNDYEAPKVIESLTKKARPQGSYSRPHIMEIEESKGLHSSVKPQKQKEKNKDSYEDDYEDVQPLTHKEKPNRKDDYEVQSLTHKEKPKRKDDYDEVQPLTHKEKPKRKDDYDEVQPLTHKEKPKRKDDYDEVQPLTHKEKPKRKDDYDEVQPLTHKEKPKRKDDYDEVQPLTHKERQKMKDDYDEVQPLTHKERPKMKDDYDEVQPLTHKERPKMKDDYDEVQPLTHKEKPKMKDDYDEVQPLTHKEKPKMKDDYDEVQPLTHKEKPKMKDDYDEVQPLTHKEKPKMKDDYDEVQPLTHKEKPKMKDDYDEVQPLTHKEKPKMKDDYDEVQPLTHKEKPKMKDDYDEVQPLTHKEKPKRKDDYDEVQPLTHKEKPKKNEDAKPTNNKENPKREDEYEVQQLTHKEKPKNKDNYVDAKPVNNKEKPKMKEDYDEIQPLTHKEKPKGKDDYDEVQPLTHKEKPKNKDAKPIKKENPQEDYDEVQPVTHKEKPKNKDHDAKPINNKEKPKMKDDYDEVQPLTHKEKPKNEDAKPINKEYPKEDYDEVQPFTRKEKPKNKDDYEVNPVTHGGKKSQTPKDKPKKHETRPENVYESTVLKDKSGEKVAHSIQMSNITDVSESDGISIPSRTITEEERSQIEHVLDLLNTGDQSSRKFLSSLNSNLWSLIFNPSANAQKFKKCVTRKNETGNCMNVQFCSVPNIAASLEQLLSNACVLDDIFIGVCCPEFPVELVKVDWGQTVKDDFNGNEPEEPTATENLSNDMAGDCGLRSSAAVRDHSWPWKAPLLAMSNGRIFCGGALINNRYVLTAAHCTTKIPRNQILVRLGEHNSTSGEDFPVMEIKRHAQYNPRTMQDDIALLKLARPAKVSNFTGVVCLPDAEDDNLEEKNALLLGWHGVLAGEMKDKDESLRMMNRTLCKDQLGVAIADSILCTEARDENERTCNADSGAPLILEDGDTHRVIGVLSWNRNDCDPRFPSTFSNVSHYLRWINKHSS